MNIHYINLYKAFLQILEPWLEYPKYYPFGFLLIHPPFETLSSTNRIQTNLTLIIVFVLAGGLPFAPSGGSQQPLWWQKTTLEAGNKCRGLPPCQMRVIEVVPMICGNYMKVLWKMIPVDYDYGLKKCFNKDLQCFILSVLRQSDLRDFQFIDMLLTAKSLPADLWVYMDVGMMELI